MEHQGYYNKEKQENYNTALYCRLSQDDGKTGDSTSIQTQKVMLEQYCRENGFSIVDFYVDDGYSGLNFNRPAFQRLLKDIDESKINLVITKDLSRLGRDYIQTGYYTEIYFPDKKVRYIAMNDGIDTIKADNDIAPFKNILNDIYAKDLSRKIKTAKRHRMHQGMYVSGQPPYGYKQDPQNKNRLIIDEEPAEVVREIFRLAKEGKGIKLIGKALTEMRILIPSAYKASKNDTRFAWFNKDRNENFNYTWCFSTVQQIMKDMVYVGDMENHKYEVPNYKTKKIVRVPKEKRIVVRNTHEPIISRDDYNLVQELIKARHTPPKHNYDNIFRSILFCSECGKRLTLMTNHITTANKVIVKKNCYRCTYRYTNPDKCTHYNYIYYNELYGIVEEKIRKVLRELENLSLDGLLQKGNGQSNQDKVFAEKLKIEKRLAILAKMLRKLYEDFASEALDIGNYETMLRDYQQEQKTLNERLKIILSETKQEDNSVENFKKLKEVALQFSNSELTAEMLNNLISRIEVKHPEQTENGKQQEINIIYRFINSAI